MASTVIDLINITANIERDIKGPVAANLTKLIQDCVRYAEACDIENTLRAMTAANIAAIIAERQTIPPLGVRVSPVKTAIDPRRLMMGHSTLPQLRTRLVEAVISVLNMSCECREMGVTQFEFPELEEWKRIWPEFGAEFWQEPRA